MVIVYLFIHETLAGTTVKTEDRSKMFGVSPK